MNIRSTYGYLHPELGSRINNVERFNIKDDHVHLWHFSLQHPKCIIDHLAGLLSREEQQRAENYRFSLDRRRFVVRRGLLRSILGMILCIRPEDVFLNYSIYGKPFIVSETQLFFNLSFSDDVGVIAISCNREIGIDIERHRSDIDIQQIAKRYFSPIEFTQLKSYGDYESIELFYRLWTCKEAIIKALGIGLSYPLDEIEITFDVDQIPHLAFRNPSRKAGQWQLFPLDISPGFSACLAADTQNDPLANNRMKPFQHDAIQFADYVFNLAFTKIS